MLARIPWLKSARNFFLNRILILYVRSQICKNHRHGKVAIHVVGQLSSRTRHRVLAVAALDKRFSMI